MQKNIAQIRVHKRRSIESEQASISIWTRATKKFNGRRSA